MKHLKVTANLYLDMRDGEDEEDAYERFLGVLDAELCNLADHRIEYVIDSEMVEIECIGLG